MSEMIERVARAIAWRHHDRKQWVGACSKKDANDAYASREWKTFVPAARAAIEAMRESTAEMDRAGLSTGEFDDGQSVASESAAARVWEAMIDAALK